jgi:hypothetical protein
MMSLRELARALDGEVSGRQVLAPGPGHSRRDRSLSIRLSNDAPDGFLVHSHADDDWQMCRDYVRAQLGLPSWEPGDGRETIDPSRIRKWDAVAVNVEAEDKTRTDDDLARIRQAQELWDQGIEAEWSKAEDYLRSRALGLPDEVGAVLRFHRACPWRNENTGQTDRIPCLIAAFRSLDDDIITGIHRIRVDQPQRWPKAERKMLGLVKRAAVKLAPVGSKLTIGEGIETCMAAMELGLGSAWALGSVGCIAKFPVIDGVDELTILAEAGKASADAVQICGRRWRQAGRRVLISRSSVGSDHNDILMKRAS